jgi:hypothetical protein
MDVGPLLIFKKVRMKAHMLILLGKKKVQKMLGILKKT